MPVLDTDALIENRVSAIRKAHADAGITRAELDVSGGVDSAVMLGLLARALGPENVTAVYQGIDSSDESKSRAREAAEAFGVTLVETDLTGVYGTLVLEMRRALAAAGYSDSEIDARIESDPTVLGSLRSCLRAPVGRGFNRLTGGGIRHGTGNECEDRWLRFYQKGGDGEVDSNPIAMLSKGEVFQLARALGVPRSILTALPTPDLWGVGDDHNDESELLRLSGVAWTYSRVNPDTGEYTRVGTIERLSRFLDSEVRVAGEGRTDAESVLFAAGDENFTLDALTVAAEAFGLTREHLASARKWEAVTAHKGNPNCPSYGDRAELLDAGIVTDALPA
jgi:NAD+ synthase